MPEPRQVPVSPSPDAARRRLHIHGIKEMPSGYDAEVAELFRDLRAASNLTETDLAQRLGTRMEVVQALEQGALYALPPWPETCRIVNGYGALLNLDVRPLLRRIYAQLEAGIVELGPKTVPEMPVMHPPEGFDIDFEPDRPAAAHAPNNRQWPRASPQPSQAGWPQAAPQPQAAPWPGMPQQPAPQQAPWPSQAPQSYPQATWPNGPQAAPQSWPSAPPQQAQKRHDGQPQPSPAQTYAPQPQAPQTQAPQTQALQPRPAPTAQVLPSPQPQASHAAPSAPSKPQKPERASRGSSWLLKWGLGALVVSVVAFGLWMALGDPTGTLGGKSLGPSGPSDQVLDPDDPRSRKADKLPSAF